MERKQLLDNRWAARAFLVSEQSLSDVVDERRRFFTSSSRKFTSAAIGGHFCVNPIPQFTDNCDIAHQSFFNKGLDTASRWWSENLDDNAQYIHLRPGVVRYNGMTTFFGNFYNVNMGSVARTGRELGVAYAAGRVIGTIGTLPLQPFILGGAAWRFMFNMPRGKYYYLSPTTYPYRYAVQTMMNAIMSNLGMTSGAAGPDQSQFFDAGVLPTEADFGEMGGNARVYDSLKKYGFVDRYGAFDIFAISTSATRLAANFRQALESEIESSTAELAVRDAGSNANAARLRREVIDNIIERGVENSLVNLNYTNVSLYDYEKAYQEFIGNVGDDQNWESSSLHFPEEEEAESYWEKMVSQFKAERDRGADFVTFRVNWTGSQSDSFSNSSGEGSLASQINGVSSRARDIRFSTSDGKVIGGPIGEMIGMVGRAVKDVATGVLDSFNMSGAIALAGNAFADIQKIYQSSSADLNRTSFTLHLRSWSADDFVRVQNVFMPLAHILALGLPRAVGVGSYDGPFMVEVINPGKTLIREGLIESITVERGVGDIGFGRNNEMLGIDVTVTIADMSNVLSVPIAGGVSRITSAIAGTAGAITGATEAVDTTVAALNKYTYGEDNKYTDYLATITSLPLESIVDPKAKWRLRMARMRSDMASVRSPYNVASKGVSLLPGEFLKVVFGETQGRY